MKLAVVGVSLKLPNNINDLEDLYNKLINKEDCVVDTPKDRYNIDEFYDKDNNIGKMRTKRGGYMEGVFDFDNNFFNISSKEAKTCDPQQRIMLELVYEALENARIKKKDIYNTKTGVFMGCCNTEYFSQQLENSENCNQFSIIGGLLTLLSNRISYYYGLIGTSLTLDTACSSSGHALHLACQSIINGENDQCIVGGSNLLLLPETTVGFSQGQFLSPDGKCKAFDNLADGYVRSEGCVITIIKPLETAIRDKNYIHCVINNTGVNQDGKTQSITMPGLSSQKLLLQKCYKNIDVNKITYMECHGTGTKIGDKTETQSIGEILGQPRKNVLPIGSLKTNIGHTEATSGLASLCKIIVMMKYRKLLPNIHFNTPSENIDFRDLKLEVVDKIISISDNKIIMGINNYGFGGSNFHCVLENYNNEKYYVREPENNLHLLAINGISEESIDKNIHPFLDYNEDHFLEYVYNQNIKETLPEAKLFIVKDKKDFETKVFEPNGTKDLSCIYGKFSKNKPNITFVFCGQGPQFMDIGIDFMDRFPTFRKWIFECDLEWKKITGFSFIEKYGLFIKSDTIDYSTIPINEPIVAQPSITFFQVALYHLYKHFNINPDYVIGHSAGEQASFYASGAITLEDTIKISYYRSIYQQKTINSGNMLVINQPINEIETYLTKYSNLELAVINSPKSFVLVGLSNDIDICKEDLVKNSIVAIKIRGSCAFHSSAQDSIKDAILTTTKHITIKNPKTELISTVTGFTFEKEDYTDNYWWNNIRDTVKFNEGIDQCVESDIFIEISPHSVLGSSIKQIYPKKLVLQSAHRKEDSGYRFLSTVAKLYFSGVDVNMTRFGKRNNKYFPKYQWNKETFIQQPDTVINRIFGKKLPLNRIHFSKDRYPYVKDHIVGSKIILPTVCYIDLINQYLLENNNTVENFKIHAMYDVKSSIEFDVKNTGNKFILTDPNTNTTYLTFNISNSDVVQENVTNFKDVLNSKDILDKNQMIAILNNKNFNFGDNMLNFSKSYLLDNSILTLIEDASNKNYKINPTIIDITLTNAMFIQGITNNNQYLPSQIEKIHYYNTNTPKYIYTINKIETITQCMTDSYILDKDLNVIIKLSNILSKNITNNNTSLYSIKTNNVSLNNTNKSLEYEFIETNDLIEIRDILNENIGKLYLVDIREHYEIVGFIRSLINESKTINYKICYYSDEINLIENLKNYDFKNIETFYKDTKFHDYDLEKLNINTISSNNYYLDYTYKGSINNLQFRSNHINKLNNGEVLIDVKSSAINFKDIAVILDIIPDTTIGYEISGIVTETKSDYYNVGDKVFGTDPLYGKGISNKIICKENYLWKNPKTLDFNESCSLGISYGTAYLALIHYGHISPKDTVLIHSATGGLGLASIEICKYIGCKIIATAGSDEKRAYLKEMGCIDFITDSRNIATYKNDILRFTNNEGVDVILSATIDEHLLANFDLLKPMGKLLDVSKKNLYNESFIPLKNFIKSIQYHSIHFDKLLESNNLLIRSIMDKIIQLFENKKLNLFNIKSFPIKDYKEVFLEFSKSKHIGKFVLTNNNYKPDNLLLPGTFLNPEKFYLITGGLGGLGIKLIEWMINQGAKKFIVTSRKSNSKLPFYQTDLNITLVSLKTDLLDYVELNELLKDYDIDGVFHLAGRTMDKLAKNIDKDDIPGIMDVKVKGIQNLGKIFNKNRDHRFFVAFSSIVSLIGNPGQSVYSAANSYMDMYCQKRNENNLPSLSINLGAIGGCGMIQHDYNLASVMMSNGIDFTIYHELFNSMKLCLFNPKLYNVCITDQDWNNLGSLKTKSLFKNYLNSSILKTESAINIDDIRKRLVDHIKNLLGVDGELSLDQDLLTYGVDSIMSMDIANWCKNNININIKQIDVLQGITINEILSRLPNVVINLNSKKSNNLFYYESSIKFNEDKIDTSYNTSIIYGVFYIILLLFYLIWYLF